jgi:crotonobetainyl-CoA:carnitine CoA-transferase CaiB-like acyl-CoA transferase
MKYLITIALLFIAVILGVVVKMVYDPFTNSTAGTLVDAGADDGTLALTTAIPWILPIMIFTIAIIMVVRDRKR